MRLVHYSREPELVFDPDHPVQSRFGKPGGLWVSDEDDEFSWSWWFSAEDFERERWAYAHEITLKPDAELLHIASAGQLRNLTAPEAATVPMYPRSRHPGDSREPDWASMQAKYPGVIITPYQWGCRTGYDTPWYYCWDCASGVIWDVSCIDKIESSKVDS